MPSNQEYSKEAGAILYMMEELGDARLRCDQLLRYLERATRLVEKSSHKDHIFEVAGDLVRAVPETAFKLHKALQAVALAADRLDYEEIKQDLRPEKAEELERVLEDVRIRHVQRRSNPMTPTEAVQSLRSLSAKTKESGSLPLAEVLSLIGDLESGLGKTASSDKLASELEGLAEALANPPADSEGRVSRARLASVLRGLVAQNVKTADLNYARVERLIHRVEELAKGMSHALSQYKRDPGRYAPQLENLQRDIWALTSVTKALDRNTKTARFEEGKPADPTENMDPDDAKEWKANTEEHKDNFKAAAKIGPQEDIPESVVRAIDSDWKKFEKLRGDFDKWLKDSKGVETWLKDGRSVLGKIADLVMGDKFYLDHVFGNGLNLIDAAVHKFREDQARYKNLGKALHDDARQGVYKAIKEMHGVPGNRLMLASEEDKQSRFEEGKPADPTENMSPADAEEWKANTEEHKDNFKAGAAGDPRWIHARYPGKTSDGTAFKKGDLVLYWPRTKTFMVGKKAEDAWRKFEGEAADEDAYNYKAARDWKVSVTDVTHTLPHFTVRMLTPRQEVNKATFIRVPEDKKEWADQLKGHLEDFKKALDDLKIPYQASSISTIGGAHNASLMFKLSLDPKDEWKSGIFQNSHYANGKINFEQGKWVLELFSGPASKGVRKFSSPSKFKLIQKLKDLPNVLKAKQPKNASLWKVVA